MEKMIKFVDILEKLNETKNDITFSLYFQRFIRK